VCVERHPSAQPMRADHRPVDVFDRRGPNLVTVDEQHDPIDEVAPVEKVRLETQLQPARIVRDVEDERAVARERQQHLRAFEVVGVGGRGDHDCRHNHVRDTQNPQNAQRQAFSLRVPRARRRSLCHGRYHTRLRLST